MAGWGGGRRKRGGGGGGGRTGSTSISLFSFLEPSRRGEDGKRNGTRPYRSQTSFSTLLTYNRKESDLRVKGKILLFTP